MIYLDNNATTFLDFRVAEVLKEILSKNLGNPSSTHRLGQEARGQLALASKEIAHFFSISTQELIFTSGATESLNMVIQGISQGHVITSSLEHIAVIAPLQKLEKKGVEVTYLSPPQGKGAITPAQVEEALRPTTRLIILSAVNSETGIKTDIEAIAAIALHAGVPFAVDGVALLGKEKIVLYPGISAFCFSSHKIHGPPGVGLLLLKKEFKLPSLILGGPQQLGKRGGTENMLGILGFSKAIQLLQEEQSEITQRIESLRTYFENGLLEIYPQVVIHGQREKRICNTVNCAFPGIEGETLLICLDQAGVAASHGSACSSGGLEPSRVLTHMGIPRDIVRSSLRFSLSRMTTLEEIDLALLRIKNVISLFSKL